MPKNLTLLFTAIALFSLATSVFAGRPPGPFRFELSSPDSIYQQGAVIEFTLRITNTDENYAYSIPLPGKSYKGKKYIYLTAHQEDKYYTLLTDEEAIGYADTNGTYNYTIKPGAYLDLRLKLYEKAHTSAITFEPHWFKQRLEPGKYRIQAWYMPYEDLEFTGRARQEPDYSHLNGTTDYLPVEIRTPAAGPQEGLEHCPP